MASLKAPFSIVVDMPGHDQALLSMLKAAHVLPDVDTLVIRAMEGAYFEGVADRAGLINHLAAMDFQLTFSDEQDPDWPVLTFEVDHLARQRKDHEAQMDALRRALQAEVDQQTKALDAAERVLAQNRERLHRAIKENDTLKDEFDAQGEVQNRALEAVQAECAALQQALAASDKRANDAEADAKMARSERQSLVAENETAQAEIKRLGEECRGLAQQLEASQASVVERDKAAQTAVAERQKLADQVAQQEARIAALLSEKDAANKKLAEHQETIKRVVTERDSARKATDTIKAEAAKSADAHRAELAKHEDAHAALKAENAKLAKERAELQETVKRAVTQRDAARAQTEQAQAENANKETALQESKTALEAALKDISAAKSTVSQKENELKAAWKRVESAETSQAETALALADARKRLKLAREEVRRAEGQIDLIKELLLAQARL